MKVYMDTLDHFCDMMLPPGADLTEYIPECLLPYADSEQERFLKHYSKLVPQFMQIQFAYVDIVN